MPLDRLILAPSTRTDIYFRPITDDERNSFNQEITDTTIRISDKEAEKRKTAKMFRAELKAMREGRAEAIKAIKSGQTEVLDTIHAFPDYENNTVHEYNSRGERILSRRMKPSERQTSIETQIQ